MFTLFERLNLKQEPRVFREQKSNYEDRVNSDAANNNEQGTQRQVLVDICSVEGSSP